MTGQIKGSVLFPVTQWRRIGGDISVVAWALQALKADWDVTILCLENPDFDALNSIYGTSLHAADFRIILLPAVYRWICELDPDPQSIQPLALLNRACQKIAAEFDVVLSCDKEMEFGCPGIQYIHFPYLAEHLSALTAMEGLGPAKRLAGLITGKFRPWMLLSNIKPSKLCDNITIANSKWTADLASRVYGTSADVIYPPVSWGQETGRENPDPLSFVAVGRFAPKKGQHRIIEILQQVRDRGFGVNLHIVGDPGPPAKRRYCEQILQMATPADHWIHLHVGVARPELIKIVDRCQFGIHATQDEHFGIAVAEMLRAGCIVFVPDCGGQVEIVGEEPLLRYQSDSDAVEKICCLLEDPPEQARLKRALATRSHQFSEEAFMHSLRRTVARFV